MLSRTYTTRSSAVAAARTECKRILGPVFEAAEGHDYIIHPMGGTYRGPSAYAIIGPCLHPTEEEKSLSTEGWARRREQRNAVLHLTSQRSVK